MSASAGTGVFVLSLMSIPICYLFNSLVYNNSAEAFFFAGCATFIFLVISARFILRRKAPLDSLFYVYAVHAFFSVVNLIIGLEQDNIIDGFVTFYLKEADPHINTAHGHMMSYWDGCVHYLMYLLMIAAITWGDNFRAIGLYWVGSFVMRSIIYLLGNAVGKYGTEMGPLFFLHLLYIAVSVWACFRIFSHPSTRTVELTSIQKAQRMTLFRRPMDLFFIIYLIPAMSFCVFRGLVALDCSNALCQHYVQHYEPYVKDPSAYPKIHDLFLTNHAVEGLLLLSLTKLFERVFKQSQEKYIWMAALSLSIDKISIQLMPWKVITFYPSGLSDVHKFQMLVSMLYSGPYYIMTLYSLLVPGCEWMLDLTLVHSGAVAQAQFSHIGASLHTRTPFSYRVPVANQPVFLLVNILYAVVPQALCYRCTTRPAFFLKGMPDKKNA